MGTLVRMNRLSKTLDNHDSYVERLYVGDKEAEEQQKEEEEERASERIVH